MQQFVRQAGFYWMRKNDDGTETWIRPYYGEAGLLRLAVLLENMSVYIPEEKANHPGIYNPDVHVLFPSGPDDTVAENIRKRYEELLHTRRK